MTPADDHSTAPDASMHQGAEPRDLLVRLGIDVQVANTILHSIGGKQHEQPAWLWFDQDHDCRSFGRWAKIGGQAPYIRGDIVAQALLQLAALAQPRAAAAVEDPAPEPTVTDAMVEMPPCLRCRGVSTLTLTWPLTGNVEASCESCLAEYERTFQEIDAHEDNLAREGYPSGHCPRPTVHRLALRASRPVQELSQAAIDVLAERRRQVELEGWTPEHDDAHRSGELASAAAVYAAGGGLFRITSLQTPSQVWPYRWECKLGTPRRNLVKAGALIQAEIERLDRAESRAALATERRILAAPPEPRPEVDAQDAHTREG